MMRRILTIFIIFFIFLAFPFAVFAKTPIRSKPQNPVVLEKDKVIEGNYNALGDSVTILGTVNGDVIAAGGEVTISGKVNGDVIATGGNIKIDGEVTQNVRVVGGDVMILGKVGRNVLAIAGNVETSKDSSISGTLTALAGGIDLGGYIGKTADVVTESLAIEDGANIKGNLTYVSNAPLDKTNSATVSGEVTHVAIPTNTQKEFKPTFLIFNSLNPLWLLFKLLSKFVIGLIIILIMPRQSIAIANLIIEKSTKSFFLGFLSVPFIAALVVILSITVIGIPLAVLMLLGYFAAIYISEVFFALLVGIKALRLANIENPDLILSLIAGLSILLVVKQIIIIGPLVAILSLLLTLGAMAIFVKEIMTRLSGRI